MLNIICKIVVYEYQSFYSKGNPRHLTYDIGLNYEKEHFLNGNAEQGGPDNYIRRIGPITR